jgi:hypothetical protein
MEPDIQCVGPRRKDLTGLTFGMIHVVKFVGLFYGGRAAKYEIRCDCGKEKEMWHHAILKSRTQSCGCLSAAAISEKKKTHGMTKSPEFGIWTAMKVRCMNRNAINYHDYGGRGISICERWMKFENFYADVGKRPSASHSLDRFPNNDGNYEPGNVRWATDTEQHNNKRNNKLLTLNGETFSLAEWAQRKGIEYHCLSSRIKRGWSMERAVNTISRKHSSGSKL